MEQQVCIHLSYKLLTSCVFSVDGVDYSGGSSTLQFSPSDDEDCSPINIIDDTQPESNEKFNVACSLVNIPAPSTTFMVTIIDNDAAGMPFQYLHVYTLLVLQSTCTFYMHVHTCTCTYIHTCIRVHILSRCICWFVLISSYTF